MQRERLGNMQMAYWHPVHIKFIRWVGIQSQTMTHTGTMKIMLARLEDETLHYLSSRRNKKVYGKAFKF